jgi:hypothetical protein
MAGIWKAVPKNSGLFHWSSVRGPKETENGNQCGLGATSLCCHMQMPGCAWRQTNHGHILPMLSFNQNSIPPFSPLYINLCWVTGQCHFTEAVSALKTKIPSLFLIHGSQGDNFPARFLSSAQHKSKCHQKVLFFFSIMGWWIVLLFYFCIHWRTVFLRRYRRTFQSMVWLR